MLAYWQAESVGFCGIGYVNPVMFVECCFAFKHNDAMLLELGSRYTYGGAEPWGHGPGVPGVDCNVFKFWLTPDTGDDVKLELIVVWGLKHTGWFAKGFTEFNDHGKPLELRGFAGFAAQLLYE